MSLLEDHLRLLARIGNLERVVLVKTGQGYQASYGFGGSSSRVDIRADPVDALLVAIGAVPVLEMNRREAGDADDVGAMLE